MEISLKEIKQRNAMEEKHNVIQTEMSKWLRNTYKEIHTVLMEECDAIGYTKKRIKERGYKIAHNMNVAPQQGNFDFTYSLFKDGKHINIITVRFHPRGYNIMPHRKIDLEQTKLIRKA